jgi:murein DD-endopeptidase MepM/ murein hydrolase activator NlpD
VKIEVPPATTIFMKHAFKIGLLFFSTALAGAQNNPKITAWTVKTEPQELVNGSPVLFRVSPPMGFTALHGTWAERELTFRHGAGCDCWYALAGVDLNLKPGEYPLRLEGTAGDGVRASSAAQVGVREKTYPTTTLSVAPKYVEPPKDVLARIEEEQALKKRLFSAVTQETYWTGRFAPPVSTSVTAIFGSARTLNGVKKTQHLGLDFRAAVGTTVTATNRGIVILARNLYYEGNCVVLDHGQGLLTLYFHLSEIAVKEGDKVESGTILGKSGNTGRVNGPHLHFAARWQGLYVDPETLLKLNVP